MLQIATDNRIEYVIRHNYTFLNGTHFFERNPDLVHSLQNRKHWLKSTFLLSELERLKDTDIDWILWLDADALIMDMERPLDSLVATVSSDTAIILANEANGVNAGSFLVANSPHGRNAMRAWARGATESDIKSDQRYLRSLFDKEGVLLSNYSTDNLIDSTRYHIAEPCALMAGGGLEWSARQHRPFWEGMFARGDFVVHFWGRANKLEMMRLAASGSLGFFD